MQVLSIKELTRLTRIELTDLYVRITNALPDMPEGSANRQNRAHQPAQDPQRAGAARFDRVRGSKNPAGANRQGSCLGFL
jgi:hypothetical protein